MFSNTNTKNTSYIKSPHHSLTTVEDEEALKGVLRRHDTDGDGVLSRKELKKAFKNAGAIFPGLRAIRALCHADKNRDGCINEEELANLVQYAKKRGFVL